MFAYNGSRLITGDGCIAEKELRPSERCNQYQQEAISSGGGSVQRCQWQMKSQNANGIGMHITLRAQTLARAAGRYLALTSC